MDFDTNIPQVFEANSAVKRINALFDAGSAEMLFGRNADFCIDLTFAWLGGRWFSDRYENASAAMASSATAYLVKRKDDLSDPVIVTGTTEWDNTADWYRLYKLFSSSTKIIDWEDHRGGWLTGGGGGGGGTGSGGTSSGGVSSNTQAIIVACGDEITALTTGVGKVTFRMPYAMTGVTVTASLTTAQSSGAIFTVDVNEGGASILSTKLTIDNTEKTSVTAATAAVVSDAALAFDSEITIDIDQVGDGTAKGLKVSIIGTVP